MLLSRQKQKAPPRAQLHMAAMIDVVFLLLIFFMCTSSFHKPEQRLASRLPKAGGPSAAARQELDPVHIRLASTPDGVQVTCDSQPCATDADLLRMLRARRAFGQPAVIIEGTGDVPFGRMVAALDTCAEADLTRVAFSAQGVQP